MKRNYASAMIAMLTAAAQSAGAMPPAPTDPAFMGHRQGKCPRAHKPRKSDRRCPMCGAAIPAAAKAGPR